MIRIPAGIGRALTLRAGQTLRIVDVEGTQVADFIAFNATDLTESLCTVHSLVSLGRLFPTTGDRLRSNVSACPMDLSPVLTLPAGRHRLRERRH